LETRARQKCPTSFANRLLVVGCSTQGVVGGVVGVGVHGPRDGGDGGFEAEPADGLRTSACAGMPGQRRSGGEFAAVLSEVDRSGAGSPGSGGSLGDGLHELHELVAVHGLLGQQQQQRSAHIRPLRSSASCAAGMADTAGGRTACVWGEFVGRCTPGRAEVLAREPAIPHGAPRILVDRRR
jgi:hypothetical protein